jgi:ORF6N domain/ParE toxin of type II toxin-antitoxin system, parDE
MTRYRFTSSALTELRRATLYYEQRENGLGAAFLNEIEATLNRILQYPAAWHQLSSRTRRCRTHRFPFLDPTEFRDWRSQFVISKADRTGLRHPPMAFTEQGVAMLSTVLRSKRAITVNIEISMRLTVLGVALGLVGAYLLTRLMTSLLFGVTPTDITTFVLVSITLSFVALVACLIPARRAARVDPLVALRYE